MTGLFSSQPSAQPAKISGDWRAQALLLLEEQFGFAQGSSRLERSVLPWMEARAKDLSLSPVVYVESLRNLTATKEERAALVQVLTVNETSFLRHPDQLDRWIKQAVIYYNQVKRPLTIWSAGCSSGEELYSLGMLLADANIPATLTGSDLDPVVLATARSGCDYTWYKVRNMDSAFRSRFLTEDTMKRWAINTGAMAQISFSFKQQNMVDDPPLACAGGWDFIFCRNVFIYFSSATARRVATAMTTTLTGEGQLWVGGSDALHGLYEAKWVSAVSSQVVGKSTHSSVAAVSSPASLTGSRLGDSAQKESESVVDAPVESVGTDYGTVLHLLDMGAPDLAAEHLRSYLKKVPNDAVARLTHANLLVGKHQFTEALAAYERCRDDGHVGAEIDYLVGVVHYKNGDITEALRYLKMSDAENPLFWPAAFLLATLLRKQGRPLPAEMAFRRALEGIAAQQELFMSRAELVNSVHQDKEGVRAQIKDYLKDI